MPHPAISSDRQPNQRREKRATIEAEYIAHALSGMGNQKPWLPITEIRRHVDSDYRLELGR